MRCCRCGSIANRMSLHDRICDVCVNTVLPVIEIVLPPETMVFGEDYGDGFWDLMLSVMPAWFRKICKRMIYVSQGCDMLVLVCPAEIRDKLIECVDLFSEAFEAEIDYEAPNVAIVDEENWAIIQETVNQEYDFIFKPGVIYPQLVFNYYFYHGQTHFNIDAVGTKKWWISRIEEAWLLYDLPIYELEQQFNLPYNVWLDIARTMMENDKWAFDRYMQHEIVVSPLFTS